MGFFSWLLGDTTPAELDLRDAIQRRARARYPREYAQWQRNYDPRDYRLHPLPGAFTTRIEKVYGPEVRVYYAVLVNDRGSVLMQGTTKGSKVTALQDLYDRLR